MGYEARHTVDWTDHVWTEFYSEDQGRWIHLDPCEDRFDGPLLYSEGWGKKLTYVIAFSKEEVIDVTCRYTRQWEQCKERRTLCPELWLAEYIQSINAAKSAALPPQRRMILQNRAEVEKKELEPRNYVKPATWEGGVVLPGRTTGSWEWRKARGELGEGAAEGPAVPDTALDLARSAVHGGSHEDTQHFDDAAFLAERCATVKVGGQKVSRQMQLE